MCANFVHRPEWNGMECFAMVFNWKSIEIYAKAFLNDRHICTTIHIQAIWDRPTTLYRSINQTNDLFFLYELFRSVEFINRFYSFCTEFKQPNSKPANLDVILCWNFVLRFYIYGMAKAECHANGTILPSGNSFGIRLFYRSMHQHLKLA